MFHWIQKTMIFAFYSQKKPGYFTLNVTVQVCTFLIKRFVKLRWWSSMDVILLQHRLSDGKSCVFLSVASRPTCFSFVIFYQSQRKRFLSFSCFNVSKYCHDLVVDLPQTCAIDEYLTSFDRVCSDMLTSSVHLLSIILNRLASYFDHEA